ncbi:hypothetical protein A2U04_00915 [Fusobacterium necrophorum subsp. funduliforme]|uniref:ImmA/IrrE family metallo-endopeptidase n=1 Tax=Fusobacterium necrophorum TaxID=859 RepID=UPI000787B8B8|nr:ImmA/IrrE family metallo-endopeptidase [Fusobacterium necrophorum]KYM50934.1 hypothetical protein A2U04_00915 [Fusobacterium necrophorum subsp. funduliforme]
MERVNGDVQYYYAQEKAYEVLLKYGDGLLPIDPFRIAKKIKNIKLMTFTEFATELQKKQPGLSVEEIKYHFESERGFLKKKGKKKYILCYNENDPPCVIKWTIFHELGHFFLGHLTEENTYLFLDGQNYDEAKESEANCFARHCCCPMPILKTVFDTTHHGESTYELVDILFSMGHAPTKYCSEHFDNYSMFYSKQKYPDLVDKYQAGIDDFITSKYREFYRVLTLFGPNAL